MFVMSIVLTVFFAVLLSAVIAALIFSSDFRKDVVAHEGEASVLGLVSVKGVAIILLVTLLLGGLFFAANQAAERQEVGFVQAEVLPLVLDAQNARLSTLEYARQTKREELRELLFSDMVPRFLALAVDNDAVVEAIKAFDLPPESERDLQQLLVEFSYSAHRESLDLQWESLTKLEDNYSQAFEIVTNHYTEIGKAVSTGDTETFNALISSEPRDLEATLNDLNEAISIYRSLPQGQE